MLDGLFPEDVIVELAAPWMWAAELPRAEEALIANAVGKRRREFAAGRTCARHVLERLGFDAGLTIAKDASGAPVWPGGVVGSISHTDDFCVVCITSHVGEFAGIGVDVEKDTPLDPGLMDLICDEAEKEMCFSTRSMDPYRVAKVIFSAKESIYKCLYPVIRTTLEFHDVRVRLDLERRRFTGTVKDDGFCSGVIENACEGRVLYAGACIYTGCVLSRGGNRAEQDGEGGPGID